MTPDWPRALGQTLGTAVLRHSPEDFEVTFDENLGCHSCGAVFQIEVLCPRYVDIINSILEKTGCPKVWGYHTAVETDEVLSEFWIRNGVLYLPADGTAWQEYFGEMTEKDLSTS